MDHPEQPALRDGDLRLRPWTTEGGEELSALGVPEPGGSSAPVAGPGNAAHSAWPAETPVDRDSWSSATFLVEWRGKIAGSVEVRQLSEGVGSLFWLVHEPYRGQGIATRAVRLLIDFAFSALGLGRVEARVNPLNRSALRVALRAGLRREGLLRANVRNGAQTDDTVLLGRLEDDPAPGTREGFTAMLDSALPLKRAIAQGVLRNERGDILLCELSYKAEWDLPGGVVDPDESPASCLVREIEEELGLTVEPRGLLAVNWMPPWLGWRDAVLLVFDLGVAASDLTDRLVLEDREIRAVHWADESIWTERVAAYTARMLHSVTQGESSPSPLPYLEDGLPPAWEPPRA